MANYITRPAIDRKAGKTDIEQLMPYLKNELETVRNNDNAKIAALTEMEGEAMANPEAYRGTKFHIDNSGFTNMNEKAKGLMRPKDGIDYSQDAINESSDVINRELTDQLATDAVDKIANTEERKTAADKAKEIGQIDTNKLAQLALGKGSQGQDLINKGIATTTPPATQQTEGSIATTSNTPTTQPTEQSNPNFTGPTLTAEQVAANFTGPTLTAEQIAANNPTKSDVLKTGTAAEKANELAKQNPGMGAGAKDKTETGSSHGESEDWTVTTDIGVGKSNIKTDAVHDIKTTQRAGIIDQDPVDLKSLKVAAGIERIRNRALAGRPGATPITTVADRLQAREAFLTDIQNKRGVVTSTKQTGGNVDAGLGETNAKFTAKRGVDERNSTMNRIDNSARLTNPAAGNPNATNKRFVFQQPEGRPESSMEMVGGKIKYVGTDVMYPSVNERAVGDLSRRLKNSKWTESEGNYYTTDPATGNQVRAKKVNGKITPVNWVIKSDSPGFTESDFNTYVAGGSGSIKMGKNVEIGTVVDEQPVDMNGWRAVKSADGLKTVYERIS